jgi:hypothetical protein
MRNFESLHVDGEDEVQEEILKPLVYEMEEVDEDEK